MSPVMAGDARRYRCNVGVIKAAGRHEGGRVVANAASIVGGKVGWPFAFGGRVIVAREAVGRCRESAVIGLGVGHPG